MKFLIVKTSSLGDILHTFPAVSYLRSKFPKAQIDWVVEEECSELVMTNPQVTNILKISTKKWRRGIDFSHFFQFRRELQKNNYDAVFDFQSNIKSGLITFLARSADKVGFGTKTVHEWPNLWFTNKQYDPPAKLNIRDDYLHLVKSYFADSEPFIAPSVPLQISLEQQAKVKEILQRDSVSQRRIMVCPGSAWPNKQLAKSQLKLVLEQESGILLFSWGTSAELALAKELAAEFADRAIVLERLPLSSLQHLMGCVDLVIAMDSLPLHLAGTTSVSTYSFFGPSLAQKFAPQGSQHKQFQGGCPYGRTFEKRCSVLRTCPTGACLKDVDTNKLINKG